MILIGLSNLSSPYLSSVKIGKDLDRIDDALDFGVEAAGPVYGSASDDVISFADYKSQEHRPD